ncbi:hypothetical protein Taro_006661 [Colocasia esculenta]|uniref:Uncharacterized protein n=1 Tax=Colocasia esculenta TaxID=4460 RepID=A0A843TYA0_COLES|nr:hypothetical protein [Colocasia esculenta]
MNPFKARLADVRSCSRPPDLTCKARRVGLAGRHSDAQVSRPDPSFDDPRYKKVSSRLLDLQDYLGRAVDRTAWAELRTPETYRPADSTVSPSYTSAGLYVSGVRGSAQAVLSTARPRQSCKSNKRELTFLYLGSSKLGSGRPGARPSHVPHRSPHRVNRRMRQWPRITKPQVTVIKATISAIRPTGGNHDHRNSAEVTVPNPAGISVTPSEIGGSSSSHCLPAEPTRQALQVRSGGREQLRTSAKRASKGFIGLVVSAPSGEKRLNSHLDWSRAMLL